MPRRKLWLAVLTAATAFCLAPAAASAGVAGVITVNTTTDTAVDTNDGVCTLREAVDSSNTDTNSGAMAGECAAGSGPDSIEFAAGLSGTTVGIDSTIGDLPVISQAVTIDGCAQINNNSTTPCVGVNRGVGSGSFMLFDVNANSSAVRGLAITVPPGAVDDDFPLRVRDNITGFSLRNSWFGMALDLNTPGTGTVSLLGDSATIGGDNGAPGTSAADRNVFALAVSNRPALLIRGDSNQVRGNYFGMKADGTTAAAPSLIGSENQIEVSGPNGGSAPTNTFIGALIDGSTQDCDDACNVIANANTAGIDLGGDGSGEVPAFSVVVAGNYIGLDKTGAADQGNGAAGISVGDADQVTIGSGAVLRNVISGNATQGINTGIGSTGLGVDSNYIGLNHDGTAAIPNETQGVVINGGGNVDLNRFGGTAAFPSNGGLVIGNVAGGGSTTARGNILGVGTGAEDLGLPGASISVNSFSAATTIGGTGGPPASATGGNVIGHARGAGSVAIGIAANNATVLGNVIGLDPSGAAPNDGKGIQITTGADLAQIGGTTSASENLISNTALDAIEIGGNNADQNQVLRNRGSGNGTTASDLFLDLNGGDGIGNDGATGPNTGIGTTSIDSATSNSISGSGSGTGDVVRVYRTATANGQGVKDIIAFVGQTTVDAMGNWILTCPSVNCATELPGSGRVTANVTNALNNSSEFTVAAAYAAALPSTTIDSGPDNGATTSDSTPTFAFSSNEDPNVTFECRVDSAMEAAFAPCGDPFTTAVLADGAHTLDVRAVDGAGNKDATPDTANFTVDTTVPPVVNPPAATPTPTATTPTAAPKKCKKGRKLKKGKCVKKKRKK